MDLGPDLRSILQLLSDIRNDCEVLNPDGTSRPLDPALYRRACEISDHPTVKQFMV